MTATISSATAAKHALTVEPDEPTDIPSSDRRAVLWAALIFVAALGVRLFHIRTSYNLFIDEVTYSEIAQNLSAGHGLTEYGVPFLIHPPTILATFAAWIHLTGTHGSLADIAMATRTVSAIFGAATTVLVFLVARRLTRTGPALLAAALIAVDPFQVSFDSRTMLEAEAQFFLILTIYLLLSLPRFPSPWRKVGIALAGLSAGAVFSGKETFGLVLAGTLIVSAWSKRPHPRSVPLTVLAIGGSCYAVVVALVCQAYGFDAWWHARLNGFSRLIGSYQNTGFNAPSTHVSLTSRIAANAGEFGLTYLVLLAGGLATLALAVRLRLWSRTEPRAYVYPRPAAALVVAWGVCSCGYLAYATLLGSIEEQMYYIVLVPCTLNLVLFFSAEPSLISRRAPLRLIWTAALVLIFVVNAGITWQVRTSDNNTYLAFFQWEKTHVPSGSTVSLTEYVAQFVLSDVNIGDWHTAEALRQNHVDYVLVSPNLIRQGYGVGDVPFLDYLQSHGRLVFSAKTGHDGELQLFDVRSVDGQAAS